MVISIRSFPKATRNSRIAKPYLAPRALFVYNLMTYIVEFYEFFNKLS